MPGYQNMKLLCDRDPMLLLRWRKFKPSKALVAITTLSHPIELQELCISAKESSMYVRHAVSVRCAVVHILACLLLVSLITFFCVPVSQKHIPECYGQASHGRLHHQLPREDGHVGARFILSAKTSGDHEVNGVPTFPRTPSRHQRYRGDRLIHWLQPGGFDHRQQKFNRPWFVQVSWLL